MKTCDLEVVVEETDDEWDSDEEFWSAVELLNGINEALDEIFASREILPRKVRHSLLEIQHTIDGFVAEYDQGDEG